MVVHHPLRPPKSIRKAGITLHPLLLYTKINSIHFFLFDVLEIHIIRSLAIFLSHEYAYASHLLYHIPAPLVVVHLYLPAHVRNISSVLSASVPCSKLPLCI
jgi:hypothetical protein